MREVTSSALKFLGVLSLYWAILALPNLALAFNPSESKIGINHRLLVGTGAIILIEIIMGFVLIGRTGWILDKMSLPECKIQWSVRASELLRIGVILLAVYILVSSLSGLVALLYVVAHLLSQFPRFIHWAEAIEFGLQIIIALVLLTRSIQVTRLILPEKEADEGRNVLK